MFTFLRAWSIADHRAALDALDPAPPSAADEMAPWTADRLADALERYRAEHTYVRFDPEARNLRHTHVAKTDDRRGWIVQQVLVDPGQENDWIAEFEVDLAASRDADRPVMWLRRLGHLTDD
jgi:hypothetical protein